MISIPIWLFVLLLIPVGVSAILLIFCLIAYVKTLKLEKDYHNRRKDYGTQKRN